MLRRSKALPALLVLLVVVTWLTGCSGEDGDDSGAMSTPSAKEASEESGDSTATTSAGSDDGGTVDDSRCPLTAEEVSEAIGATVQGPESPQVCQFGTTAGIIPGAGYDDQPGVTCTPASLAADGYSDSVDGLAVDAYSMPSGLGVSLLVCNGDQPFGVFVEVQGDDLAGAVALAQLVLDG